MIQISPATLLDRAIRAFSTLTATLILAAGCTSAPPSAPRCRLSAPALTTGHLRTDGTRLRDELGRVVSLRGVNAGGRSKWAPFAPFDFEVSSYDAALAVYLDRAAAWGANVMRVPFTWAAVEPTQGADDEAFLRRYDALLDAAWARGIRTIVDFHQDIYAEVYCGDGFPAWTIPHKTPAPHHDCPRWYESYGDAGVRAAFDAFWQGGSPVQAAYVSMWQRMIARHRDRAGVIGFELFNEPSAGTAEEMLFETTILPSFYTKMALLVNGAAPDALVFFDSAGITSATLTTALVKPGGANLVYAPHYYQALTIFGGQGRSDLILAQLQKLLAPRSAWSVPAFLGEWGAASAALDSADMVAGHYAAFDTLGLGGAQWQYSVAKEVWNAEPLDMVNADGTRTPMMAGLLRPWARAISGDAGESWDGDAHHYTLHYKPSAAAMTSVTDVTLPTGAFAKGYDIALTGGCFDDTTPGSLLVRPAGSGDVTLELTGK